MIEMYFIPIWNHYSETIVSNVVDLSPYNSLDFNELLLAAWNTWKTSSRRADCLVGSDDPSKTHDLKNLLITECQHRAQNVVWYFMQTDKILIVLRYLVT